MNENDIFGYDYYRALWLLSLERMYMTILIVEDEAKMREFIKLYLVKEGYDTLEAADGQEALDMFAAHAIDLIILDVMMPKLDGFQVCQEIRAKSNVAMIMLTAVEGELDQVKGYDYGVDDYVLKPFKIKVLLAKISRILRVREDQKRRNNMSGDIFELDGLVVDVDGRKLFIEGQEVDLSPKVLDLLLYMVHNKGLALTRWQILEGVWGYDFEGGSRVVDNHIKKLRKKLAKYAYCVETVVTVGYRFVL